MNATKQPYTALLQQCLTIALIATALCLTPAIAAIKSKSPVVAAASSMQFALEEIASSFTAQTGQSIRLIFGSSGNFARQIRQSAPFELFLSANEDFINALTKDGLTRDAGRVYALGRLALALPLSSPLKADATLIDLKLAIHDGRLSRFAIANPEHAPYGLSARQALEHQGVWTSIQPKLVLGENVSQTAQFALSANTQGGIIAWSLAQSPRLNDKGRYLLIPQAYHQPLRHRMVLLNSSGRVAEDFYHFLQQEDAARILKIYGFDQPAGNSKTGTVKIEY